MALCKIFIFRLLLLTGLCLAGGTVSDSFKECSQFFYMHTVPTGIRGDNLKRICQRYGDKLRYATLYDSSRRLALYSAYTFKKSDGQRRMDTPWMYEPQRIHHITLSIYCCCSVNMSFYMVFDCPLNPDQHQADNQDKAATYTLTNVVPQITDLLEGPWAIYIDTVRRRLNNFCRGAAYVVTGVTVSGVTIRRGREDRMAIPKHLWSTYCCPRFDRNSPYDVRYMFPTYAAYALNEIVGHSVTEVPLKALETFLKNQTGMDKSVNIFFKDCLTENTHTNSK
uniref:Si:dkey-85k7.11 n=1 Tax=Sinocyclocheilus rhinocerous TaxID=307959 RepID=A0A673IQC3_9TELE